MKLKRAVEVISFVTRTNEPYRKAGDAGMCYRELKEFAGMGFVDAVPTEEVCKLRDMIDSIYAENKIEVLYQLTNIIRYREEYSYVETRLIDVDKFEEWLDIKFSGCTSKDYTVDSFTDEAHAFIDNLPGERFIPTMELRAIRDIMGENKEAYGDAYRFITELIENSSK